MTGVIEPRFMYQGTALAVPIGEDEIVIPSERD